jgi:hypothetical protein
VNCCCCRRRRFVDSSSNFIGLTKARKIGDGFLLPISRDLPFPEHFCCECLCRRHQGHGHRCALDQVVLSSNGFYGSCSALVYSLKNAMNSSKFTMPMHVKLCSRIGYYEVDSDSDFGLGCRRFCSLIIFGLGPGFV